MERFKVKWNDLGNPSPGQYTYAAAPVVVSSEMEYLAKLRSINLMIEWWEEGARGYWVVAELDLGESESEASRWRRSRHLTVV